MHKARQTRQQEAAERKAKCAALTPAERLAKLDRRYGKGVGGARERQRLLRMIEAEKAAGNRRDAE